MEEEFKGNSYKDREEKALPEEPSKSQKIVKGKVVEKKRTGVAGFIDNFVAADAGDVKNYVVNEVIIPGAKKIIMDTLIDSVEIIFNGETGSRRKKRSNDNREYCSYRNYYQVEDDRRPKQKSRYAFGNLYFEDRGEAEMVLDTLRDNIDQYDVASVLELHELVGKDITPNDNKYGWSNLDSARIVRDRDGSYILKLPRALPID